MEGSTESMFEIGDKVVYGVVGVCEVENIDTPPIKGISGDYYFLQPVFDSKGIIYSPVDSNKVMIRSIMTVKECDKLKERARNCKKDGELSEKVTPMQYDEHMKSQDALKLMHLIRALYVIKNERAKDLRKMKSAGCCLRQGSFCMVNLQLFITRLLMKLLKRWMHFYQWINWAELRTI